METAQFIFQLIVYWISSPPYMQLCELKCQAICCKILRSQISSAFLQFLQYFTVGFGGIEPLTAELEEFHYISGLSFVQYI